MLDGLGLKLGRDGHETGHNPRSISAPFRSWVSQISQGVGHICSQCGHQGQQRHQICQIGHAPRGTLVLAPLRGKKIDNRADPPKIPRRVMAQGIAKPFGKIILGVSLGGIEVTRVSSPREETLSVTQASRRL